MTRFSFLISFLLGALLLAPPAEAQGLRKRLRQARQDARQDKRDAKTAREGTVKEVPVHGGKLVKAAGHSFEVVLLESEVRVYATRAGVPVELKGATARVSIGVVRRNIGKRGNHQSSSTTLRYVGVSAKKGRLRGFLSGTHKLGKADRQAVKLEITVSKVPKVKGSVSFETSSLGTSALVTYTCAGCSEGAKTPRRYFDPGTCPECKGAKLTRVETKTRAARRNP